MGPTTMIGESEEYGEDVAEMVIGRKGKIHTAFRPHWSSKSEDFNSLVQVVLPTEW